MRTTIRLDDDLLAQAKAHAAQTRRTLNDLIEASLRAHLASEQLARPPSGQLPTFKGRGLMHGVDINDSSNLVEYMETSNCS